MGKTITSPVEKFSGSVTLLDPVPYPVYIEWNKAMREADITEDTNDPEKQYKVFQGILLMVEKWDIKKFSIKNPPATPRTQVLELLAWLVVEIGKIINGEIDPN